MQLVEIHFYSEEVSVKCDYKELISGLPKQAAHYDTEPIFINYKTQHLILISDKSIFGGK